jgi:hypothetical protein
MQASAFYCATKVLPVQGFAYRAIGGNDRAVDWKQLAGVGCIKLRLAPPAVPLQFESSIIEKSRMCVVPKSN